MRIVIFGAGSLGSALGALLAKNNEVVLIGRRRNMSAIRAKGLRAVGDVRALVKVQSLESVDRVDPPELLIVTTKAYDTVPSIEACREWVSDGTAVLTLQNGLGNLEALRDWKGKRAFGGTTTLGANLVEPGRVRISGIGRTVIGSDLDATWARRIAHVFSRSGLPTVTKKEIRGEIWAKAVVSACINPMTAILRVPNGRLLESKPMSQMLAEVCSECEKVAEAEGVKMPYASMVGRVKAVVRDTRENRSSMLQDIERGRRTEIAQINGAFVRYGISDDVRTPVNLTLLAMVEGLGKG